MLSSLPGFDLWSSARLSLFFSKYMRTNLSNYSLQGIHQQVEGLMVLLHSAPGAESEGVHDLASVKGDYIMPTLNGWLLGYPVVYLVDEATVEATADHLSSESLERHIVMAVCPALQVCLQGLKSLEIRMARSGACSLSACLAG